jgi:aspartyl-tRNA(Asn)/glutamyl-tRNA(Gln) amidotransferase subunit A
VKQNFCGLTVRDLSKKIEVLEISPLDLVEDCLDRIKKLNCIFNTFITISDDNEIYENARKAERDIKLGRYKGPLHGIPFSVKDNFFVKHLKCTAGSKILSSYIPSYDAFIVRKLKKSGAILIGKNNLNEFAAGITGINPFYGNMRNPWNKLRIAGGSSGGSAAAVSSGMIPLSVGTDTGGSVRVPSALCGVVGLKPTFGLVSRHGVIPLSPSLDHVGFISKSAWDIAALLEVTAGQDPLDETTVQRRHLAYTKIIEKPIVDSISIGIPSNYFMNYLDRDIESCFYNFLERIKPIVSKIQYINLNNTEHFFETWRTIRLAEASAMHLDMWNTRLEDYSKEVRKQLKEGKRISAYDYLNSKRIIGQMRADFSRGFASGYFDIIAVPTTITSAPLFTQLVKIRVDNKVIRTREALLRNTVLFNSIGLPAISIPIGLTSSKMPVGAQLISREFEETKLLSVAYSYELENGDTSNLKMPFQSPQC